ncbi:hypothetical protein F8S13_22995 [Chloroflexia bacterium SDU3-3]|nr:hypothetical protein F8S13_22995 [Chloroflexia bacterium SDU3-3]
MMPNMEREGLLEYAVGGEVLLAAQPQPEDFMGLLGRGVRTVINLRGDAERAALERQNAEAAGLCYIHLPLPMHELEPQHLAEAARAIAEVEGGLCIHCRGARRASLLWALYRVVHLGWSPAEALAELAAAGYNGEAIDACAYCIDDYLERTAAV